MAGQNDLGMSMQTSIQNPVHLIEQFVLIKLRDQYS